MIEQNQNKQPSSAIKRDPSLLSQHYDLVIIGGGITGVSIAREAALRGVKTLLLEKGDFCCATSGATSKLLHGGLRYLENMEFSLVRESLAERRIVASAAGHLVEPLPIILPIYNFSKPGRMIMQLGLWTYDLLSFDRNRHVAFDIEIPGSRWLDRKEVLKLSPHLNPDGLQGGFLYYDFLSRHPERLLLAFLKDAVRNGAVALNHLNVRHFNVEKIDKQSRVKSIIAEDRLSSSTYEIHADCFINATGPWMDILLSDVIKHPVAKLSRSQGIHLLVHPQVTQTAVLYRNRDGRHFFAIPWMGRTLIGPTDTPYRDDPDLLYAKDDDVDVLLEDASKAMPGAFLNKKNVQQVVIGLRPLIFSGKNTYRASRKSEIYDHAEQGLESLFSVAGGKWTTSRKLGESVVKKILKKSYFKDKNFSDADSSTLPLAGAGEFAGSCHDFIENETSRTMHLNIPEDIQRHLITLYGSEHVDVLALVEKNPALIKKVSQQSGEIDILAQVLYAIRNEGACTLQDILLRRLVCGTMSEPTQDTIKRVLQVAAKELKWSAKRQNEEMLNFKNRHRAHDMQAINEVVNIKESSQSKRPVEKKSSSKKKIVTKTKQVKKTASKKNTSKKSDKR